MFYRKWTASYVWNAKNLIFNLTMYDQHLVNSKSIDCYCKDDVIVFPPEWLQIVNRLGELG